VDGRMSENIFFDLKDLKYCGENVIIGKTVRVRQPHLVSIGDGTIIDDFTYISSGLEVGKHCHIASNVSISGGKGKLTIGDYSTLSTHVSVHCGSSDYRSVSMDLPSVSKKLQFGGMIEDINIEDFVTVGAHSCILPGSHLPKGSAYGAFTLIKKIPLKSYHLYVGNKCTDLGERDLSQIKKLERL
jgi:dTDP-4-amino-4,6-dideoxy-D-glucose acyltransferase